MEKQITLVEALCGAAVHIQHLDGRILRIATPQGAVQALLGKRAGMSATEGTV